VGAFVWVIVHGSFMVLEGQFKNARKREMSVCVHMWRCVVCDIDKTWTLDYLGNILEAKKNFGYAHTFGHLRRVFTVPKLARADAVVS
jgi:hypothetical protein